MTDTAWHGVTPMGTTTAGDLISALKRVAPARSRHERSPLGGTMLYAAGGALTVWASDGAMLAVTQAALDQPDAGTTSAVVPSGWLAALRARFDRAETVELGVRREALLVRRPGEGEALVQPLWPAEAQLEAYRELFASDQAAGVASVRGKELLARLRRASGAAAVTLAVEPHQLTVLSGSETAGAVPIASTLEPQRIVADGGLLADAVAAVTNLKLPNAVFEPHDGGRVLRLYGASAQEPATFGSLDCFIRSGPAGDRDAAPETGEAPGEATVEEANGASPIDEVLAELDGIIGQPALKKQVRALQSMVEINRKRAEAGLKAGQVGAHMVFAGPPGTGKTTVARLIAKLFHALGALDGEEVVEVSRTEIVSDVVGGTEKNMRDAVERAQGGVLFVDEAYAFAAKDGSNDFGPKAIEVLLKAVEDSRDSFVCILAGYTDRMREFMASNPGLRSRFARQIDFEAYSAEELVQIAKSMARSGDNDIDEGGIAELARRLDGERSRGGFDRKDWGNARSVRNIVEQAAMHRDVRISLSGEHDRSSLVTLTEPDIAAACDDFKVGRAAGKGESVEEVLAELDAQIGQPQLKQQVRAIVAQAKVAQAKQAQGLSSGGMALEHLLFTGPPGTGKTTVARLLARLYRALGVLPNDGIVEVNQSILVAGYKGQTAIRTREKVDEALGGVLFIDEAYTLVSGDDSFGQEAVDELLPRLENDRGKFVAIAAGYPDDMARFVASNVGLQSRFTTTIEFVPYTSDELVEIALSMATGRAETLTEGAVSVLRERLAAVERGGGFADKAWGNARSVRNVLGRAIQLRDVRVSEGDLAADPSSLVTVTEADMLAACERERLVAGTARESADDVLAELDEQIGQSALKEQVRALVAQARLAEERVDAGIGGDAVALEHLLFVGPPGTGKTTIARLIGRLYGALGLLPKGHLVQVDRTGLVGQYVGQTAPKTNAKVDEAMGGVLFIDEAYALVPSDPQDYGGEAIDALVPRLTDDKNRFIAIAAGYPDDMRRFVAANVGLRSRFTTTIEFAPYDPGELVEIAALMARRRGQRFGEGALEALRVRLEAAGESGRFGDAEWGNAREMSNLVDDAMKRRDLRLHADGYSDPDEMVTLAPVDVVGACEKVLGG